MGCEYGYPGGSKDQTPRQSHWGGAPNQVLVRPTSEAVRHFIRYGARPEGYSPMKKQGGLILGIGGDNSHGAVGTFYEGAVTAGYSSDAADARVQASIAAAGYGH